MGFWVVGVLVGQMITACDKSWGDYAFVFSFPAAIWQLIGKDFRGFLFAGVIWGHHFAPECLSFIKDCHIDNIYRDAQLPSVWLEQSVWKMQDIASQTLTLFHADLAAWLEAILFGKKSGLSSEVTQAFRAFGLYHVLVVSGLHFSIVASLIDVCLRIPWHGLYALRLLGPRMWISINPCLTILTCSLAIMYGFLVSLPVSCQRAMLACAVMRLAKALGPPASIGIKLQCVAVLQTLFFPETLMSSASFMSWTAYLILLSSKDHSFLQMILCQIKLSVTCAAIFGDVSLVAPAANLLIVPIFPVLMFLGLLTLIGAELFGIEAVQPLCGFQDDFLALLVQSYRFISDSSWAFFQLGPKWILVSILLWCVLLLIALNACRELSIRD